MVEIKKIFGEWSEKLNVPVVELEKEYNEYTEKIKKDRKDLTSEQTESKGLNFVRGLYSRQFSSNAKTFSCFVLGHGDSYDPYKKERDGATAKGFINQDGVPVFFDPRPSLSWRKDSAIPLPEDDASVQRFLYGAFALQGTKDYKRGVFYLQGKKLNDNLPEKFIEYKVRAGCKEENLNKSELSLNTAGVTRFEKVGEEVVDLEKIVKKIMPNSFTTLEGLENFKPDTAPLGLFAVKGLVVGINITKDEIRSNAIELAAIDDDPEKLAEIDAEGGKNVTIWLSKEQPIDFGVGSEVVVLGSKYIGKNNTAGYNAVGVYISYNSGPENKPLPITKENSVADSEEESPKDFLEKTLEKGGEKDE